MCAQIILLHGASSSGKTTLARAVQASVELPFWHISVDHLRDSGILPMDRFRKGDFDWSRYRDDIFDGFHAAVSAFADAGNNLIVEHILDGPGWAETVVRGLRMHDVFFVGLQCDLQSLKEREARRGDRPTGSAARDFATIHNNRRYDLELDGTVAAEENAQTLLAVWRSGRRKSEFSGSTA